MADSKSNWQATASPENLQKRAQLLAALRQFFAERNVLEVETPVLGKRTVSDVHLQSFDIPAAAHSKQSLYLQTSPEYAMKRLLAGGSGSIYQITKAFRQEEQSKQHNPEFTLLEWYRIGFSLDQLMDEVEELVRGLIQCQTIPRFSYQQLFETHLNFDPHSIDSSRLQEIANKSISISTKQLTDTDYLQLLMSHCIEPQLPEQCFVFDYPVAQAALARLGKSKNGITVARRFELYCQGMELANGYAELTDSTQQRARFEKDNAMREQISMTTIPADERLIDAMDHGLPECAGVAMGVDRLAMILCGSDSITDVISFPFDRA